ncbi:Ankyrin repeat [Trinorchestia longiramus]|nr:Ankyrin repeat [Trinorchestia longiramus]
MIVCLYLDAREQARQELHGALREACGRGDVAQARALLRDMGDEAVVVVNAAPNGAHTLLYKACEEGHKELVRLLLESGADDRIHPVTKYSPLYIAANNGRRDIAEMLLKRFPGLASVYTVEKWLPLHACVINGHLSVLTLLLSYPYPPHCLTTFRDRNGRWQYQFGFDCNWRDVTGQSALYLASYCANHKMVELMLKLRVPALKIKTREELEKELVERERAVKEEQEARSRQQEVTEPSLWSASQRGEGCAGKPESAESKNSPRPSAESSPSKSTRISGGIQALMSKLNLSRPEAGRGDSKEDSVCPFDIDLYCNSNTETALHVAVKNRHHTVVGLLLAAGANPNLRIYLPDDKMAEQATQNYIFTGSTALVEACRNHDLGMVEMLLKNHARDDQCKALFIAAHNNDTIILSKLLALKAHPDPEYKIQKRCLEISPAQQFGSSLSVTHSGGSAHTSICPTVPVMINWHGQRCLPSIKEQWLVDASVQLNPKLRLSPRNQAMALYAITRLDISNNSLTSLPSAIFSLPSLRILNAGQNKLEQLSGLAVSALAGAVDGTMTLPRRGSKFKGVLAGRSSTLVVPGCTVSVLEEIHLQDNRLDYLPEGLFSLPALQHLDVSNNKLMSLPYKMWSAPKLRDLNVSLNLLSALPTAPDQPLSQLCGMFLDEEDSIGEGSSTSSTPKLLARPVSVSSSTSFKSCGTSLSHDSALVLDSEDEVSVRKASAGGAHDSRSTGALSLDKHGNVVTCCRQRELRHHSLWTQAVQVQDSLSNPSPDDRSGDSNNGVPFVGASCLQNLNLSHNAFCAPPAGLPCLAVALSRLNLSYNRLNDMGRAWQYPGGLKQLDLSHNNIACWPCAAQGFSDADVAPCPAAPRHKTAHSHGRSNRNRPVSSNSVSSGGGGGGVVTPCSHRRHTRLESLRTLVLADNQLTTLALYLEDPDAQDQQTPELQNGVTGVPKGRLVFPSLSMLDVSNNCLSELPLTLHHLTNLAVLNISGNPEIQELPPEMGLLSRMWNLNTRGCSLQEPLKSMIESKKYKTMDVIGYLKSILEDARPYARMKLMVVGVAGIGKTSLLEQLRQEGTGSYRKKPVEHWAARMGNRNISTRTSRGGNMSTVGVDIGDWTYEKKVRGHSSHGPVVFRTWDFGGQKEYYATHQYFLSKRSLYLVVWKITDGERAIDQILQWLVNIQARAPNSAVLIVGTHYDLVRQKFPPSWSEDLQQLIRERFINVIDADKLGLPRVLDTIEVSCKSRHNVKLLCNLIYDTVFSLKSPGSKERLLEQRIPATYLALEDVVAHLALERRLSGRDPVLTSERYQAMVSAELTSRGLKPFRDTAELNQATSFLHENGVLLHYDDATLKELYFLDPQWLCDMLAHVVTIREINPFAKNGVMKLDDLKHVFKSSSCAPVDAKSYIVSLLNKFEVALTWDNRTLLIPSLLPSLEQLWTAPGGTDIRVKIPLRCRGWAARNKRFSGYCSAPFSMSVVAAPVTEDRRPLLGTAGLSISSPKKEEPEGRSTDNNSGSCDAAIAGVHISHKSCTLSAIRRLLLMSYFPSGFWSRLITRILADDAVAEVVRSYFALPPEVTSDGDVSSVLGGGGCGEWLCWQSGLELRYANTTLLRIAESTSGLGRYSTGSPRKVGAATLDKDYHSMRFLIKQEGVWSDVEIKNSAVLEVLLPNEAVVLRRRLTAEDEQNGDGLCEDPSSLPSEGSGSDGPGLAQGIQSVVLDPAPECVTKLLAIAVDHIDTLLEDWYPTLGTRFVHTSEGKLLITRLLPCPVCLECHGQSHPPLLPPNFPTPLPDNWGSFVELNPLYCSMTGSLIAGQTRANNHAVVTAEVPSTGSLQVAGSSKVAGAMGLPFACVGATAKEAAAEQGTAHARHSYGSCGSAASDRDSGVDPDSNASSRNPSAEGRPEMLCEGPVELASQEVTPVVYSFMVEECILAAYTPPSRLTCPLHGLLLLAQIAPDTVFLDLGEQHLVVPESVQQGKLLGRGGFGFVFQGTCRHRTTGEPLDVALKMLQPVDPGQGARPSALQAYKACVSKWERDPLQYACKAYCCARQEVNILLSLRHSNIVPFVGVCPRPLALVLELAPQGALDQCLKHYRRSGARLDVRTLQALVLQVAKALEYLHGEHIIYRDLKSENVLVWELPLPFSSQRYPRVDVRLADYGISRASLPSGTKGFGGTEGFMAPEMMRFNGEEEYTEKVDVFSFGMFLYELLTTHQPYEQCDNVKELVLEGGRPALTYRETSYPLYLLDLMVVCWSSSPRLRPSASQVVSVVSAPEFPALVDVASLEQTLNIMAAVTVPPVAADAAWEEEDDEDEGSCCLSPPMGGVWVSRTSPHLDMLTAGGSSPNVGLHCSVGNAAYGTGGVNSSTRRSNVPSCGWSSYSTVEGLPDTITAMCCVDTTVWLGDTAGTIHGYSHSSSNRLFSYCLEPDSPRSSAVQAMTHLHSGLRRVAVALANGRLFVCCGDARPTTPVCGEGSFVMTELAADSLSIHCMAVTISAGIWKLWCGVSSRRMSVFSFRRDGLVINQETVSHNAMEPSSAQRFSSTSCRQDDENASQDEEFYSLEFVSEGDCEAAGDVLLAHAIESYSVVSPKLRHSLWTYCYPGSAVYHWDAVQQTVLNRLDCSKLVPCSESLQSISIEERLSPANCKVSALGVCGRELYVGTSWGCIIVAEAVSMRPITVFRPFESEVRAILPLCSSSASSSSSSNPPQDSPSERNGEVVKQKLRRSGGSGRTGPSSSSDSGSKSDNGILKRDFSLWNAGSGNVSKADVPPTLSPSSQKSMNVSNKSSSSMSLGSSSSESNAPGTPCDDVLCEGDDEDDENLEGSSSRHYPMVATIGKGYRDLLARYVPLPRTTQQEAHSKSLYCLLWQADTWTH